jgi:ribose 5-phosphate isomerase B
MKIAIGSDHGGYELKEGLKQYLANKGFDMVDVGTYSTQSCDYPEFGAKCAKLVADGECRYGIVVCTTGEGIVMAANKVKGVRAGLAYNVEVARLMREHNDANVIGFGAKFTTLEEASERVDTFLATEFAGGRHSKRVEMLNNLDK